MLRGAHAQAFLNRRIDLADRQRRHRDFVPVGYAFIVLNDSDECNDFRNSARLSRLAMARYPHPEMAAMREYVPFDQTAIAAGATDQKE